MQKEDCDAERISRVIFEASKGSSFFANEQKKQQRTQLAIEKMLKRVSSASQAEIRRAEQKVNNRLFVLRKKERLS